MDKNFSVYVKTDCPFCKKAISILEQNKLSFIVIVVDKNLEFLEEIKQKVNHSTVPIVLEHSKNGVKLIGGSDNLENYINSQEFKND